jgi:nicotinamidase-related amidase
MARRGRLHAFETLDPRHTALVVVDLTVASVERAQMFAAESAPGSPSAAIWPELDVVDGDLAVTKLGASAFFPGRCDLHRQLEVCGVDTVLIAGTVTNVCCESSARDATELGYRVTMISDACAGHGHGLHEASLTTFYRIFGDVRPRQRGHRPLPRGMTTAARTSARASPFCGVQCTSTVHLTPENRGVGFRRDGVGGPDAPTRARWAASRSARCGPAPCPAARAVASVPSW